MSDPAIIFRYFLLIFWWQETDDHSQTMPHLCMCFAGYDGISKKKSA